jgi:hypothetical protein
MGCDSRLRDIEQAMLARLPTFTTIQPSCETTSSPCRITFCDKSCRPKLDPRPTGIGENLPLAGCERERLIGG